MFNKFGNQNREQGKRERTSHCCIAIKQGPSFYLNVLIICLCMYVPDPHPKSKKVEVVPHLYYSDGGGQTLYLPLPLFLSEEVIKTLSYRGEPDADTLLNAGSYEMLFHANQIVQKAVSQQFCSQSPISVKIKACPSHTCIFIYKLYTCTNVLISCTL